MPARYDAVRLQGSARPDAGWHAQVIKPTERSSAVENQPAAVFAPIDKYWIIAFGLFTIVFAYVAERLAMAKPFWNDEIYTILVAGLPSLGTIWRATEDGMDLLPPLNSMLTHGIHTLFGVGRLMTRLPPVVGYWTMTLVVFDLVRRRSHVV